MFKPLIYSIGIGILLTLGTPLSAQTRVLDSITVTRGIIRGNDTIPIVYLEEVKIYTRKDFEYLYERRRDRRLVRNVKKAYPYARIAGDRLRDLDRELAALGSKAAIKDHIDDAEEMIMEEFEKDVRKLTITQGIILVKLIDRETGRSSYQVIKDLKGGFTAFFWQGIARIFGNNLKAEYDPAGEDYLIEDIVRGIEAGFI